MGGDVSWIDMSEEGYNRFCDYHRLKVSPLGFVYRWKIGIGLEAALAEEMQTYPGNHDFLWRASRVPGVHLMFDTPGEVECALAARDAAVAQHEAELIGVVAVGVE